MRPLLASPFRDTHTHPPRWRACLREELALVVVMPASPVALCLVQTALLTCRDPTPPPCQVALFFVGFFFVSSIGLLGIVHTARPLYTTGRHVPSTPPPHVPVTPL